MSWLLSKALMEDYENSRFSREQVAESLGENSLDGEPCALWNGTHTRRASWLPGKTTDACRLSRSGMTFKPLTENHGADVLTWYLEDSLAKTFPPPVKVPESKVSEAECGNTWRESSVKFDLVSRSWKTHRCLWEEGLPLSSVILPRWGMMRDGVLWERTTPEHLTSETESGLWPTPCLPGNGGNNGKKKLKAMLWPTPQASDNRDRGNIGSGAIQRRREKGKQIMLSQSVSDTSVALNPQWVEWLMGWPLGWTNCDASGTDKFRQWCASHGKQ